MVLFNYSTKELTAKIVYYGPGLCGKTTNLQFIHENLSSNVKGKMLSLATKTDRTLFFDFLPMDLGEIRGMKTRMQLYTVPGQVFYNETRKLVLKGVDGLVFVADSQKEMIGPNIESFKNLEENLKGHGHKLAEMPHVIQFNKRDLPKLASIEELNAAINKYNAPFYETVATTGIGVQDSLKAITKLVLLHLTKKYDPRTGAAKKSSVKVPAARTAPPPAPKVELPRPAKEPIPVAAAPISVGAPAEVSVGSAMPPSASTQVSEPVSAPPMGAVGSHASGSGPDVGEAIDLGVGDDTIDLGVGDDTIDLGVGDDTIDLGVGDDTIDLGVGDDTRVDSMGSQSTAPTSQTSYASEEIDDLMAEVDPPAVEEPSLETIADEPAVEQTMETPAEPAPSISVNVESVPGETGTLEVSDVLTDAQLFNDPSLEIAHLAAGQTREIVIPVQIAGQDDIFKRFKLSLRLKLDSLD